MAYTKITATHLVTTPMYLGSSSPTIPAGRIREASFKGALRFWWRAITWHKAYEQAQGQEREAIALLRQWEANLFGTASDAGSANSHASPFRLRCQVMYQPKGKDKDPWDGNGWRYLKGQGLARRNAAFAPGTVFEAHLLLSDSAHVDPLLKSLVALGLFGGIGARSRRGVGSVAIQSLKIDGKEEGVVPHASAQLKDAIAWLGIEQVRCPLPPLAAFSEESRIDWWRGSIEDFGFEFLDWRSFYDHTQQPPVRKQHPNFRADHDEMLRAAQGDRPSRAPERAVFGLPHNYYFRSLRRAVQVTYGQHDRHASPYFIHVHEFETTADSFVVQTFLPNQPVEDQLCISGRRRNCLPYRPKWKVVQDFMDYMRGNRIL